MSDDRIKMIESLVRDVLDFPKPGIVFKDITPLLASPVGFVACLDLFAEHFVTLHPDVIVGIESRGFIFGAALAARMNTSFVPVRKPGKLPWQADRVEYSLEYGTDALEMHRDALPKGARVLVVDDLMATGGTVAATFELVRRQAAEVVGAAFLIELMALEGRKRIAPLEPFSILQV